MAKNNRGELMLEQNLAIDDSLLPSAIELEHLKEVDPKIIDWILQRTEIEQNARIEFNKKQVELAAYNLKKTHRFNFTALFYAFILFLAVLSLSAFLIINKLNIEGTLFGGTAIITGIIFFIKATKSPTKK
jgi:uncharacterized membrane protein